MPTISVKPDGTGDYTTLDAAILAIAAGSQQPYTVECYRGDIGTTLNISRYTFTGWYPDASNQIDIVVPLSERHHCDRRDCSRIEGGLFVGLGWVNVTGLAIYSDSDTGIQFAGDYISGTNVVDSCLIVRNDGGSAANSGVFASLFESSRTVIVRNTTIYSNGLWDNGIYAESLLDSYLTMTVQNCAVLDAADYGFTSYRQPGPKPPGGHIYLTLVNNKVTNSGTADYDTSDINTLSALTNLSSDGTATSIGGTGYTGATQSDEYVADDRYWRQAANATGIDSATDLSGTFTDDALGETRPAGAWDLGPVEGIYPFPFISTRKKVTTVEMWSDKYKAEGDGISQYFTTTPSAAFKAASSWTAAMRFQLYDPYLTNRVFFYLANPTQFTTVNSYVYLYVNNANRWGWGAGSNGAAPYFGATFDPGVTIARPIGYSTTHSVANALMMLTYDHPTQTLTWKFESSYGGGYSQTIATNVGSDLSGAKLFSVANPATSIQLLGYTDNTGAHGWVDGSYNQFSLWNEVKTAAQLRGPSYETIDLTGLSGLVDWWDWDKTGDTGSIAISQIGGNPIYGTNNPDLGAV